MTEIQSELQSGTRGEILSSADSLKNALNNKPDSVLLLLSLLNNAYNNGGYFSGSSLKNHIRLKGPTDSVSESFIQQETADEAPAAVPADADTDFLEAPADFEAPAVVEVSDSVVAESLPVAEMITESIANEFPVIAVEISSDSVAAEAPMVEAPVAESAEAPMAEESPVAAVEIAEAVAAEAPMVEAPVAVVEVSDSVAAEEAPMVEASAEVPDAEAPAAEAPAIVEVSDSVIADAEAPAETQAEPVAAVEVSDSVVAETPVEPMAVEVSDAIVSEVLDAFNSEPPMFEAGVAAPASETEINAAATVE